jgi:hypothetical protein
LGAIGCSPVADGVVADAVAVDVAEPTVVREPLPFVTP